MAVSFAQLNKEFNQILDKVTHLAGLADVEGVTDQLEEINILIGDTLKGKVKYEDSVRSEFSTRDLSAEKIRNALGLRVEIPRFTGHDSELNIYTFRAKFEKFVAPYI